MRRHGRGETERPPEERFRGLYEQHVDAVRPYVRRRAAPDAADDVVADTFLVCWRRLDRVPPNALPWLYAIARERAVEALDPAGTVVYERMFGQAP